MESELSTLYSIVVHAITTPTREKNTLILKRKHPAVVLTNGHSNKNKNGAQQTNMKLKQHFHVVFDFKIEIFQDRHARQ